MTFNPEPARLALLLERLHPQVTEIVVVDNGSGAGVRDALMPGTHLLRLGENLGVAAAQNQGVRWALEHGAGAVLLMDRRQHPGPGYGDAPGGRWHRLAEAA
ncbi:MAG: glycosyltransferase [Arhodomonas sp.]|nr:glycosyltransferase [Arhodomonas sp.]